MQQDERQGQTAAAEPAATLPLGPVAPPTERPAPPGYEVLGELGRGGMGVVYKARQVRLNRLVALKMILSGAHAGGEEVARFRAEAEAVARLQHPNIVQVHETGEHDGSPYFSMEFCAGGSLEQRLAAGPLPPAEAAALVEAKLAGAVAHAHRAGVVHRDLKPANVLFTADGVAKVTDFGLVKRLDGASDGRTRTGSILGTPSYMAPEQAAGRTREVGPAADVYALGAVLYHALTGRPPFRAASTLDTVMQVLESLPAPPRMLNPQVPRALEAVCLRCLEKLPADRYLSAADLAQDLRRFAEGEPVAADAGGASRIVRAFAAESRHTRTLALFGRVWRWQAVIMFAMFATVNALQWAGLDDWRTVAATLCAGLAALMAPGFYYLFPAGRVRSPVERQMDHVWAMFLVAVALTAAVGWRAELPWRGLLPIFVIQGAFSVGCTGVVLRGSLYLLAGLCGAAAMVMAWFPAVGPLAFGVAFGVGLFVPAWRYTQPGFVAAAEEHE